MQLQNTNTTYRYKTQIQNTTTKYKYKIQNTNTKYKYKIQLQNTNTKYKYKLQTCLFSKLLTAGKNIKDYWPHFHYFKYEGILFNRNAQ